MTIAGIVLGVLGFICLLVAAHTHQRQTSTVRMRKSIELYVILGIALMLFSALTFFGPHISVWLEAGG